MSGITLVCVVFYGADDDIFVIGRIDKALRIDEMRATFHLIDKDVLRELFV